MLLSNTELLKEKTGLNPLNPSCDVTHRGVVNIKQEVSLKILK